MQVTDHRMTFRGLISLIALSVALVVWPGTRRVEPSLKDYPLLGRVFISTPFVHHFLPTPAPLPD